MSADIPPIVTEVMNEGDDQDRLNTERPLITEGDCEENPGGVIVANSSGKLDDDEDQPPTDDNSDPKREN